MIKILQHVMYLYIFYRLRRVPPATMERAILLQGANSPWPVCCEKCFCGKDGGEANTLLLFKALN